VARLRCDLTLVQPACVEDLRPDAPVDYGASCGLGPDELSFLRGEAVVTGTSCPLCQVIRTDDCLRQACTIACSFDEDCPARSICLCGDPGSPVTGYCAAATDRETDAGRAAGLPVCL
jgi:hypothetical protein